MSGEDSSKPLTYRDAGVDIDAGDALVDAIKPLAASTRRPGADGALGGFGGLFDLKAAGFKDPVLVSGTDGVGTKLMLAFATNRHETIGIDLVAMCVNDLVVQGAEPLLFLDYYATSKLEVEEAAAVVGGIAAGCDGEPPGLHQHTVETLAISGGPLGIEKRLDVDGAASQVGR